jgi:DNA (cytosine-5)-methyltransferase 1
MKFIDLFAGVGGFRIALEKLGNTCVFSSENNQSCQRVYEDNFGDKPYGDINKINPSDIPDFDILTAGFPCQPFSLNGKKEGFSDKISGTLFFNIVEIAKAKLPKIIFLENVKGIVTHDKGNTIQVIEKNLKSLGYKVHTKVLNTYDFGIPQNRERWYCVAFKENCDFEFPIGNEHGSCLEEIIDKNCDSEKLKLPDIELKRIEYHFKNSKNNPRVKHSNSHCNPKSKKGKFGIYSYLKPDNALRFHTGDPSKSQIQDDYYVSIKSIAPTLIATRAPKFWDLKRYTSIEECKKLQGFPEKYDFSSVSINTAKKQLGNAVTVKVIERIADQIMKSQYSYDLSEEQKVHTESVEAGS